MQDMRGAFLFCAAFFAGRGRQVGWLPRYFFEPLIGSLGINPDPMEQKQSPFQKAIAFYRKHPILTCTVVILVLIFSIGKDQTEEAKRYEETENQKEQIKLRREELRLNKLPRK